MLYKATEGNLLETLQTLYVDSLTAQIPLDLVYNGYRLPLFCLVRNI